jgi:O-antigen ligase
MSAIKICLTILSITCASVPMCYGLAFIPCLIVIQSLFLEADDVVFSIGPADVSASDFATMLLCARYFFEILRGRDVVRDKAVFTGIAVYLGVVFLASIFSSIRFGQGHAIACFTSCIRLVPEMLVVAMMANAVKNLDEARRCAWILIGLLGVLVAIQFVNAVGASRGFAIGEVQGMERGEPRYFGPVGDSVGFVLLLGYLLALCHGRLVLAGLVIASIVLTAGLGSMFAAAVATGFFLLFVRQAPAFGGAVRRLLWAVPILLFAGLAAVVLFSQTLFAPLLRRADGHGFSKSGEQRIASGTMAKKMFEENPFTGVGYMGYERALFHYGGEEFFNLAKLDGGTANANNQFLQTLSDAGLPGIAAFTLLMFAITRRLWLTARRGDPFFGPFYLGAFLWVLTMIFGNLAAIWINPSYISRIMWIVTGSAIAVGRLLAEREDETAAEDSAPQPSAGLTLA